MMMTFKRLQPIVDAARAEQPGAVERLAIALTQRVAKRGPSKLARRLIRKARSGLSGAF